MKLNYCPPIDIDQNSQIYISILPVKIKMTITPLWRRYIDTHIHYAKYKYFYIELNLVGRPTISKIPQSIVRQSPWPVGGYCSEKFFMKGICNNTWWSNTHIDCMVYMANDGAKTTSNVARLRCPLMNSTTDLGSYVISLMVNNDITNKTGVELGSNKLQVKWPIVDPEPGILLNFTISRQLFLKVVSVC